MKTLIIRPAALGDTLLLAPALLSSSEWGEVIVAGRKPGIDFLRPLVSGCLDFEGPGWHGLFMDIPEPGFVPPVREADKIIAFLKDPQGIVRGNLERLFPGSSVAVLPGYPAEHEPVHVALHLARALKINGIPVDADKAIREAMERPLLRSSHRTGLRIVLHPGSGGEQKNHPPGFWLDLLWAFRDRIASTRGAPMILLGPAEEKTLPLFSEKKDVDVLFSPNTEKLALLLEEASLYIGHDSGVTHLAAMLGAPTVALFRHTSLEQWSPLGPKVKVIQESENGPELLEKTLKAADGFLKPDSGL